MKKEYSLDYNIERDTDRCAAIHTILGELEHRPSNADLEQMASYILYGRDEEGMNSVQRKETYIQEKRYNSYKTSEDRVASLDEVLENPLVDESKIRDVSEKNVYIKRRGKIERPKIDKEGNQIDPGDSDIPGMVELWEAIDATQHTLFVAQGKIAAEPGDQILTDPYRIYQLKHQLIDMRRQQYYLKDSYKPTIRFLNVQQPSPQMVDWSQDGAYWISPEEWQKKADNLYLNEPPKLGEAETRTCEDGTLQVKWVVRHHTFDWENIYHIRALMNCYSEILQQSWEKPDSWARTLVFDFDYYCDLCNFSDLRLHMILRKIDKWPYGKIQEEIHEIFGIKYDENHISTILANEIPKKIAKEARKRRLLLETPQKHRKFCPNCGRRIPLDPLFFGINRSLKDGYQRYCRECETKKRFDKKGGKTIDKRTKDTQKGLSEVPNRT